MTLKNIIARIMKFLFDYLISPVLSPIIALMAMTGWGTDTCLKWGCLPVRVHFYQPVPDIPDLEKRNIWDIKKDPVGIDFAPERQTALLSTLGERYGQECDWPTDKTDDPLRFFTENEGFSYGCAASLHCILRNFRPKTVIEIGSGNSSLVIHGALTANNDGKPYEKSQYTIIDPYPGAVVKNHVSRYATLLEERVEMVSPDIFFTLGENDVLFIDSSHMVRIGGDVNRLLLDIIPRLPPGVIIHFHDIPFPYEYPKVYCTNPAFRMFWTESYLLQAFLLFNDQFEVMLAMRYLMQDHPDIFKRAFPHYDETKHKLGPSGSFWIRRVG